MNPMRHKHAPVFAFTLIELLVVIAIIAILAVVVVLTLNPSQLLAQSRDANRVSDMATLNTAIGLYQTDTGGIGSVGTSSIVYTSLADTSSTCGTWNLPTSSSFTYNCTVSASTRNTNSSGWIPIDFTKISAGSPLGSLPLDPVNASGSGLYYTYNASSSQFMVSAIPESAKQKLALAQKPLIPNYPDVIANGSNFTISPLFNTSGLAGYWPMDEGSGSTTIDLSGNGNNGNWSGATMGTSGYYSVGKIGNWAGTISESPSNSLNYIFPSLSKLPLSAMTISEWVNPISRSTGSWINFLADGGAGSCTAPGGWNLYAYYNGQMFWGICNSSDVNMFAQSSVGALGTGWHLMAGTYDGATIVLYLDGLQISTSSLIGQSLYQGGSPFTNSNTASSTYLIDDVRIYNRALSAAEVQALYNAGR